MKNARYKGTKNNHRMSMQNVERTPYVPPVTVDMDNPVKVPFDTNSVVIASVGVAALVATTIGVALR